MRAFQDDPCAIIEREAGSMDQTYPDLAIGKRTVSAEGVVCCCSGAVIPIMDADEWSEFALGQLVALGVATFILTLITLALSQWSTG
jgi:hypothetical protein